MFPKASKLILRTVKRACSIEDASTREAFEGMARDFGDMLSNPKEILRHNSMPTSTGLTGLTGPQGIQGDPGADPSITIGSVTVNTLTVGSSATVDVTITPGLPGEFTIDFEFGIPVGATGATGATGAAGADATELDLTASADATEISYGSPPTATVTVTPGGPGEFDLDFDFELPEGAPAVEPVITASASATGVPYGDPATADVTVTDMGGGEFDLEFVFEIPEGEPGAPFTPTGHTGTVTLLDGDGVTTWDLTFTDGICDSIT